MIDSINRERWRNLRWNIQRTRNRIAVESDNMPSWCQVSILHELLVRLESFADEAVDWMHDPNNMPEDQPPDIRERKPGISTNFIALRYPPEYARFLIIQQAAHDLGVIWHIYTQRRADVYGLKEVTHVMKKLAEDALEPARKAGLIDGTVRVIPYLQKVSSIRLIPYANVALLGMPYWLSRLQPDALTLRNSLAQDMLAIPHEVGHFVYWYGRKQRDGYQAAPARWMKKQLIDTVEPNSTECFKHLLRWNEEMFADVYGVKVAKKGASIASLMDLLQGLHWQNEMTELSDSHPPPYIRPYGPLAALTISGEPELAKGLAENWRERGVIRKLASSPNLPTLLGGPCDSGDARRDTELITAFEETSKWAYRELLDESTVSPGEEAVTPQNTHEIALAEWGRIYNKVLDVDNQLSFEISWQAWVDSVFEEYDHLDLSSYMTDRNKRWVVALSGGGWTEGPASAGNRPG